MIKISPKIDTEEVEKNIQQPFSLYDHECPWKYKWNTTDTMYFKLLTSVEVGW